MKHSEMLNLNLPEDSDLINVGQISDNFERLDSMVDILPVQQETTTTDIDIIAYPPYWSMTNNTDSDIEYVDHDFWDEKFVIEAGKTIRTNIDAPTEISISSEVTIDYVYYIPAKDAFSGGGSGGTSDYNKLSNQPKVNGVKLTGDKSAADLGLASASDLSDKISSDEKGASNGIATLDADGKVPQSQLPTPVAQKEYKIVETTSESYAKSYKLQVKNGETWSDVSGSASINIPKDMVVESGSVKECTTDNVPVSGYKKGDKYIDLVIANKTDAHIYINVKDLVDNKASGISYNNTTSKLTATTVQAALDEIAGLVKANESAISDINETLEDKVNKEEFSALEEKVDKKQNKTFIETVDSETSVVTVPEGTSFAAVGKISGKTVKNLFTGYTNLEHYSKISETYNGHECIQSHEAWYGAYDANLTLKAGHTYYISAMVRTSTSGVRVDFYSSEQALGAINTKAADTWERMEKIVTIGSKDTGRVRVEANSSTTITVSEFMVVESSVAFPYFSGLASAPIKSVVSCGRNFASLDDYGVCEATTNKRFGYQYTGLSAGTYTINATVGSSTYYIAKVSTNGSAGDAIGSVKSSSKIIKVTLGEGEGIVIYNLDNYDIGRASMAQIMVCKGDVNEFIPYNKTTVSIPDEVRNCEGYGLGISDDICNTVDFENGVYTQKVGRNNELEKLKDWLVATEGDNCFYSSVIDGLKPSSTILCSKYNCVDYSKIGTSDKSVCVHSNGRLIIHDSDYSNATQFRNSLVGVEIIYSLNTPTTTLISDYILPLSVESGGTINLENEHSLDVNNTVLYKKEVL